MRAKAVIESPAHRLRRMVDDLDEATVDALLARLEARHGPA